MKRQLLLLSLVASLANAQQAAPTQRPSPQPQKEASEAKQPTLPALPSPFPGVLDNALPLTPSEIKMIRQRQDDVRRAASDPIKTPPKPRVRHHNADLSPGSTPPVARLASGHGTGVAFMDMSGAPWPIVAIDLANKEDFGAALSVPGTNVVTLNSSSEYGQGNMLVFLKDLPTPVVITLFAGQRDVDYRLDVRIPSMGPNARPEVTPVETHVQFNRALGDILDGIVDAGLKPVLVNGAPGMAWRSGGRLLLRTQHTLMSPAPIQMTASQDGTRAYELDYTPQILVSQDGRLVALKISE